MSEGGLERKYGGTTPKKGRAKIILNNESSASGHKLSKTEIRKSTFGNGRRRESILFRHRS